MPDEPLPDKPLPVRPDGTILVTVPERVSVTYVVAAPEDVPADPESEIIACLEELPFAPGRPPIGITVEEIASGDASLAWAEEVLCCPDCSPGSERLLGALMERSRRHLAVTCTAPPGWPPLHLWAAARAVCALAERTGGIALDADAPRLLPTSWRPAPAPEPGAFAVSEWVWIGRAADETGHSLFTTGLARLGLPELTADGLAAEHVHTWGHLLNGLALRLVRRLFAHTAEHPGPGTLAIPDALPVTAGDVAAAEARPAPGAPAQVTVRLRHERDGTGTGPRPDRLTVHPPDDDPHAWFAESPPIGPAASREEPSPGG
jgi:hypothetical protein